MKKKVYHWLIPENVYRVPMHLLLVKDDKAGVDWIKKNYLKKKDLDCSFLENPHAQGHFLWEAANDKAVVWITDPLDIPCLTHEITHYTMAVLEQRGVPLKEDCSEAFTYLLQGMLISAMLCLGLDKYCGKTVSK